MLLFKNLTSTGCYKPRNVTKWDMLLFPDYTSNRRLVRWRKKMVTIMNSFLWKLVLKSAIIFKILINVTKYLLMICSCHNWQNKRKATDVRWRRKICDQVTALHTGIIDHLFLIFSFKICIAPPVLTKNWYICNVHTFTIPNTEISRIFDQSERCWLVLFFRYDFEYPFCFKCWNINFRIWNLKLCREMLKSNISLLIKRIVCIDLRQSLWSKSHITL